MKVYRSLLLIPACIALLIGGCDSSTVDNDGSTYSGTNGYVLNGNSYSKQLIECNQGSMQFIDANEKHRAIIMAGGYIGKKEFVATLGLPTIASVGEFKWVDGSYGGIEDAYLNVARDEGTPLNSISGKTTITSLGAVGEPVTGTFSGTLMDPGSGEKVSINGKFTVHRLN